LAFCKSLLEAVSKSANVYKITLDSIGEQTPTKILTTVMTSSLHPLFAYPKITFRDRLHQICLRRMLISHRGYEILFLSNLYIGNWRHASFMCVLSTWRACMWNSHLKKHIHPRDQTDKSPSTNSLHHKKTGYTSHKPHLIPSHHPHQYPQTPPLLPLLSRSIPKNIKPPIISNFLLPLAPSITTSLQSIPLHIIQRLSPRIILAPNISTKRSIRCTPIKPPFRDILPMRRVRSSRVGEIR
jgi:hypothetical protein